MSKNLLDLLEVRLLLDQINPMATPDEVLQVYDQVLNALAAMKALKASAEERMIEWIDCNGAIETSELRYYVGDSSRTKPRSLQLVADAIMEASGGDIESFAQYLSSNPFKVGPCRTLPQFDELFETTVTRNLKTGKPKRVLKTADKKWLDRREPRISRKRS